jgi:hypothetical protein
LIEFRYSTFQENKEVCLPTLTYTLSAFRMATIYEYSVENS